MTVKVGDEIYVGTSLYVSHGADDFIGGKATVTEVSKQKSGGKMTTFVRIAERTQTNYNWGQVLSKEQTLLAQAFGNDRAHASPDYREEFNKWEGGTDMKYADMSDQELIELAQSSHDSIEGDCFNARDVEAKEMAIQNLMKRGYSVREVTKLIIEKEV